MPMIHPKLFDRMRAGAKTYAKAERSDPFAFNRATTHILNGVAGITSKPTATFNAHRRLTMRPFNLKNVTHVIVAGQRLPVQRRFDNTGAVLVTAPTDFPIPPTMEKAMTVWPVRVQGYPQQSLYMVKVAGLPLIRGAVS